MRENFRQNSSAKCLHVVGFDVAVEKSKSSDHEVVGFRCGWSGSVEKLLGMLNAMPNV